MTVHLPVMEFTSTNVRRSQNESKGWPEHASPNVACGLQPALVEKLPRSAQHLPQHNTNASSANTATANSLEPLSPLLRTADLAASNRE